jgi:hypothetical protein
MRTTPKSFRLRPETLAQLERLAELLTVKFRRQHEDRPDDPALAYLNDRTVNQTEALAVAVSDTLQRLEREVGAVAPEANPHRAAADAGRGLLANLPGGSMTERRAEAAAEDGGVAVAPVPAARRATRRRRGA